MKKTFLATVAIASLFIVSCNSSDTDSTDSKKQAETQNEQKFDDTKMENDAEFVTDVADGGMLEVKLGDLAQTNSTNAQVKELGMMLKNEHAKANADLVAAAKKNNVTVAADISNDSKKKYDDLAVKKGADFDKDYTALLKDAHAKTIEKLEKEISDGKNADIKAWATATLPVIKHHNEMILKVHDDVRK